MAATPIPEDRAALFGQRLVVPLQPWVVFAEPAGVLITLAAVSLWLKERTPVAGLQSLAVLVSGLLFALALLLLALAWRLSSWKEFQLVLTRTSLTLPTTPLWACETLELPLSELQKVHYDLDKRGRISSLEIVHQNQLHTVLTRFLGRPWSVPLVDLRIEVRRALLGKDPHIVVGVEAALLGVETPSWGVVVTGGEDPIALWVVDAQADYQDLVNQGVLPAGHHLVLPDQVAPEVVRLYTAHPYRKRAVDMPFSSPVAVAPAVVPS